MTQRGHAIVAPLRFRRRLAFAFVVVAGLAAGMLAIGTFLLVRDQRFEIFERRSNSQTQVAIELAREGGVNITPEALTNVIRDVSGFDVLVVNGTAEYSTANLDAGRIPRSLREVGTGLRSESTTFNGSSYYVVGAQIDPSTSARMYFFFDKTALASSIAELRNVLLTGWAVVTALSFAAGRTIAIRTLAPIQMAANAARQRAEGLLHVQLDGSKSDEFRAWARYFDDVAAALETKLEELSAAHERERRFTADVAHDLRTPLGAMVSACSILGEYLEEMPEGARRPTELLINDVSRLRRLVTDLLEIGRLDAQQERPNSEPIDVDALLRGVVLSVRGAVDVPVQRSGAERIYSDRVRLERVLANLVENAFVHGGSEIAISAVVDAERLVVDVIDDGPGIPPDQLPHIFDRFHKAEASRTGAGSGLGLAIAAQHVSVLGGSLTAENLERGGARFRVEIPATPQP